MKKNAAPFAVRAVALLIGIASTACSGGQQFSGFDGLPQGARAARAAAAGPTPIPFTFQTVDDPSSTTNAVTGIDGAGEIVGTIGNGAGGYTSVPPYTTFVSLGYSGAGAIGINGLSVSGSTTVVVGYVAKPPSLRGTWGYYIINGLGGLTKDRKGLKGKTSFTDLLGVNDSETGVGYDVAPSGLNAAFVLDIPTLKYKALNPPGASSNGAEATGINDVGDIVGWVGPAKSATGFLERLATYYSIAYPGAKATEALGINTEAQVSQEQVVGGYHDASGMQHGFLLTGPTLGASGQVWQSIDEPNGAQGTVVTGINANDDICGYYVDSNGVQHGFVAVPNASGS